MNAETAQSAGWRHQGLAEDRPLASAWLRAAEVRLTFPTMKSSKYHTLAVAMAALGLSRGIAAYAAKLRNPGCSPRFWGQSRACARMVRKSRMVRMGIGRARI